MPFWQIMAARTIVILRLSRRIPNPLSLARCFTSFSITRKASIHFFISSELCWGSWLRAYSRFCPLLFRFSKLRNHKLTTNWVCRKEPTDSLQRICWSNPETSKRLISSYCPNSICHSRGSGNPAFSLWTPAFTGVI